MPRQPSIHLQKSTNQVAVLPLQKGKRMLTHLQNMLAQQVVLP